ncbi:hypothetical protein [Pyxidicoccus xibeiensis]|uniref:hypothetical protein n=1 Tax=Pyxidicoccus xibeiensis TaxID=2906759 RepID=UPI0020A80A10|nr:hypothetical protein [Pyxidicoccus xibeiensis]MCP3143063.1 hypothetical protein [Pyxidicoccus xibeiensis]
MKAFLLRGLCVAVLGGTAAQAQQTEEAWPGARESDTTETVRFDTREDRADTGIYALVGGGAEGYVGQLAPAVNPGLSYGATLGYRPMPFLGFEVGYSGGLTDVDAGDGGISDGPDIVRNGGKALIVGNLTDTKLQPYVLTGVGIDTFNVRDDTRGRLLGFEDDTSSFVPAGIGLRYQLGNLITADARVNYDFLLGQDFAPTTLDPGGGDGRYQATLSLGGTY